MIIAIINIVLILLNVLTITPFNPLPPGLLTLGSGFAPFLSLDGSMIIGAPIITVPGVPGLRSDSNDPSSAIFGILHIPPPPSPPPPTQPINDPYFNFVNYGAYCDFVDYSLSATVSLWVGHRTLTRGPPPPPPPRREVPLDDHVVVLVLSLDDTAVVLVLDIAEVAAMIAEWELMDAVEAEEIRFRLHLGRLEKKPNPKYRYPPPPPVAVAIPPYRLNFSIFNDVRVAWSRRKRRNSSLQPSTLYHRVAPYGRPVLTEHLNGLESVSLRHLPRNPDNYYTAFSSSSLP
ncbi:hypothetical protein GY45DRAFT_547707 [Cubamyces sp. BRFM 1775]|nr:hypothetical protein GY45DRAFT_547707 [Cubamyces sp. BRFM 1775]